VSSIENVQVVEIGRGMGAQGHKEESSRQSLNVTTFLFKFINT
jgi:hypothetical protein